MLGPNESDQPIQGDERHDERAGRGGRRYGRRRGLGGQPACQDLITEGGVIGIGDQASDSNQFFLPLFDDFSHNGYFTVIINITVTGSNLM